MALFSDLMQALMKKRQQALAEKSQKTGTEQRGGALDEVYRARADRDTELDKIRKDM